MMFVAEHLQPSVPPSFQHFFSRTNGVFLRVFASNPFLLPVALVCLELASNGCVGWQNGSVWEPFALWCVVLPQVLDRVGSGLTRALTSRGHRRYWENRSRRSSTHSRLGWTQTRTHTCKPREEDGVLMAAEEQEGAGQAVQGESGGQGSAAVQGTVQAARRVHATQSIARTSRHAARSGGKDACGVQAGSVRHFGPSASHARLPLHTKDHHHQPLHLLSGSRTMSRRNHERGH